jgi:glycine cleavage system H protein
MTYPPGSFGPPGHILGYHYPGTLNPMYDARLAAAQDALAREARREAARAARLAAMAGRWLTPEHTWLAVAGDVATAGITDYAAWKLGGIVHVSLPGAGARVAPGEPCAEVESVKAISELGVPVEGLVSEVNERLAADPGLVSEDPFGEGWLFRMTVASGAEAALRAGQLCPEQYEALTRIDG